MSTVWLDLYSLTDLCRPGAIRALGDAFDADERLRPDRMDRNDPIREKIRSAAAYLGGVEALLAQGPESYLFERRSAPRLGGGITFDRRAPEELKSPHRIYLSLEEEVLTAEPNLAESLGDLFVRLADAFDGYYGFATHSKLPWQQRVELVEAGRRGEPAPQYPTMYTDRTSVRDVYWLNYFGPSYVERWGDRLNDVGVRQVETSNRGRVIWAAESPFLYDEAVGSTSDYAWKQPFYEALGRDTFVHLHQVAPHGVRAGTTIAGSFAGWTPRRESRGALGASPRVGPCAPVDWVLRRSDRQRRGRGSDPGRRLPRLLG